MLVGSYNCHGLRLGSSKGDRARRTTVDNLLMKCDILCLQETFLSKQDLGLLSSFNKDFHGVGESTTDLSDGILRGRIAGGVAILWHKKLDPVLSVIRLGVDWCIAMHYKSKEKECIILNVYTPYECQQNEDDYLSKLAFIHSFIQDNSCTCVFVVGDWNSDIADKSSLFAKHLVQLCEDSDLTLSSQMLLPADSYTYISEAWHTTSWLDHCVTTADAHANIRSMEILYEESMSDHIPFTMFIETDCLPELIQSSDDHSRATIDWSKLSGDEIGSYCARTDVLLSNVFLPYEAIMCSDFNCMDKSHHNHICLMYEAITQAICEASVSLYANRAKSKQGKPGWSKYVAPHHVAAKEAHREWVQAGRPRQGLNQVAYTKS